MFLEIRDKVLQSFINSNSQKLTGGRFPLKPAPLVVSRTTTFRILNNRQLMFGADKVTQPCYGFTGISEIAEFVFAVKRRSVPINVIMDMGFVRVRTNIESVFTFQKSRGEVISDLIRFFRCHFSGFERLTNLVNKDFILFLFPGEILVLPF